MKKGLIVTAILSIIVSTAILSSCTRTVYVVPADTRVSDYGPRPYDGYRYQRHNVWLIYDANLQVDRAVALAGVGRAPQAIDLLREQVLSRDPGMQRAHHVLLELLIATGRKDEARIHVAEHSAAFRNRLPPDLAKRLEARD